jgi:hypothetical protein
MKHFLTCLALLVAASAHGDELPEGAWDRAVSQEDQRRLIGLLGERSRIDAEWAPPEEDDYALSRKLMAELYGPSPDLAVVEQLDRKLKDIRRRSMLRADAVADFVYRGLSPEDRLKFMKMNHGLPPRIETVSPPQQSLHKSAN